MKKLAMKVGQGFSDVGSIPTTSTWVHRQARRLGLDRPRGVTRANDMCPNLYGVSLCTLVGVNWFRRDSARHWSQSVGDYRNSAKQNCQFYCAGASPVLHGSGGADGLRCLADEPGYGRRFLRKVLATESLPIE